MEIKVDFDVNAIDSKIQANIAKCQIALDAQALKDSNFYCPLDTSMLQKSGINNTKLGSGKLIWNTPYASNLYYNERLNISKQRNPFACRKWFEVAKTKNIKNWEKLVNDEYSKNDK